MKDKNKSYILIVSVFLGMAEWFMETFTSWQADPSTGPMKWSCIPGIISSSTSHPVHALRYLENNDSVRDVWDIAKAKGLLFGSRDGYLNTT